MSIQDTINAQNKYVGLDRWHEHGLTGKGVTVWNTEGQYTDDGAHAAIVSRRIRDAAPDCNIVEASLSMTANSDVVHYARVTHDGITYDLEDFIKIFDVSVITRSIGGGTAEGKPESIMWNELKAKYNLVFFNSAGNDSTDDIGGSLPSDVAIWVGACNLMNGTTPTRATYSSVGEQLDFMTFTGVWAGTSFSAPYLAGQAVLLKQKYGKNITQEFVYEYFKKHSKDLGTKGLDDFNGYGIPILGEPSMKITLQIGSNTMKVDESEVKIDQTPTINPLTKRTLIPLRAPFEAFGATVTWDATTKTIIIER